VGDTKFTQLRYACSGSAVVLNRSFAVMALSDKVANYYREARWRAQRRTSAWNILLFPFCIGSGLVLWYALFQLVWMFHVHVYPDHQFNEFWQRGISTGNFALSLVMMFAPAPGAMVLGFTFYVRQPHRMAHTSSPSDPRRGGHRLSRNKFS